MYVSKSGLAFCTNDVNEDKTIDEKFENALIASIL